MLFDCGKGVGIACYGINVLLCWIQVRNAEFRFFGRMSVAKNAVELWGN